MNTIKELLKPVTSKGLSLIVLVDTSEFSSFCQREFDMTNNEWGKKIWRKYMCDDFMSGSYVWYDRFENPENEFEEMLNAFLDAYPELEDSVKMIFTN